MRQVEYVIEISEFSVAIRVRSKKYDWRAWDYGTPSEVLRLAERIKKAALKARALRKGQNNGFR